MAKSAGVVARRCHTRQMCLHRLPLYMRLVQATCHVHFPAACQSMLYVCLLHSAQHNHADARMEVPA